MEKIKFTFLGTGSAIPTKTHNHSAFLINYKDENILIDCGEGTQRQFRYANLNPGKITRLLITHWHGDHTLGIPGLLQTLALNNYSKKLFIYGPEGTKYFLTKLFETFVFVGKIDLEIKEISSGTVFETDDFEIKSLEMSHGTKCLSYSFIEKEKIRIDKRKIKILKIPNSPLIKELQQGKDIVLNGKKIKAREVTYKEKARKISLITDTGLNKNILKAAQKSDLLILEASFDSDLEAEAKEYNHLTAEQAATIAKKADAKALYLIHLSQRYEKSSEIIEKQAKRIFKKTTIAKDLQTVEI